MKKVILTAVFLLMALTVRLDAQSNIFGFQYSVAYTVGDMNNFIERPSFRGLEFDYHHFLGEKFAVGFEFLWNNFYEEKTYDTYTDGTASISGKQYRYCLVMPMLVSARYYFKPGETICPFAGFGLGTAWSRNDVDMGLYRFNDNAWHFTIKPEAGIIYNPNSNFGVSFSVKYFESFKSGNIGDRSYVATNLGMAWTW